MICLTDDAELKVGIVLDREHPDVDLTQDRLGEQCLDCAVAGILDAHTARCAPDGTPWAPLARSTVKRKKHAIIGIDTGKSHLLDPSTWTRMDRSIKPREAWLIFPPGDARRDIVHGWQNGHELNDVKARPLLGWTEDAEEDAEALVKEADFRARE